MSYPEPSILNGSPFFVGWWHLVAAAPLPHGLRRRGSQSYGNWICTSSLPWKQSRYGSVLHQAEQLELQIEKKSAIGIFVLDQILKQDAAGCYKWGFHPLKCHCSRQHLPAPRRRNVFIIFISTFSGRDVRAIALLLPIGTPDCSKVISATLYVTF